MSRLVSVLRSNSEGGPKVALIAEIKRRSPSKGDIAPELDPAEVAKDYAKGGASCLSVLTDGPHFGGSREDLEAARAAVALPLLRKDFTVCAADLYDARIMGADAVLLIVGLLSHRELEELFSLAGELGLACLVEVHDEAELERAKQIGAGLIGVNQRDLHTFEVDTPAARRLGARIPQGIVKVAESGVDSPREVAALAEAGFDAVLVGESLLRRPTKRPPCGFARSDSAMWVKICGITGEEDALLAVAMGADAVGFVFAPSPRQMSPKAVAAITRRLPPEICTVGVFRDEEPRRVVEIVNEAGLDAAQLHGRETFEDCGYVSVRVPLVIKAFPAGDERLARAGEYGADIVLLDAPSPGRARSSTGASPKVPPKDAGSFSPEALDLTTSRKP